jgi:hypothetical protein
MASVTAPRRWSASNTATPSGPHTTASPSSVNDLARNRVALLDTMFDLPSLGDITGVEITRQVVEGTAPPLHIYSDRSNRTGDAIA